MKKLLIIIIFMILITDIKMKNTTVVLTKTDKKCEVISTTNDYPSENRKLDRKFVIPVVTIYYYMLIILTIAIGYACYYNRFGLIRHTYAYIRSLWLRFILWISRIFHLGPDRSIQEVPQEIVLVRMRQRQENLPNGRAYLIP